MTRLMLTVPLLVLAGCVAPPPPAATEPDLDACKASSYQGLVGQPRSVLRTMLLPAGSRVIGPGDAITMDFNVERLNVEIGTDDRISKIACY